MYIQSKGRNSRNRRSKRVAAGEEINQVDVAPEATDLLFEAEDVAELLVEVTGESVDVTVDDDNVTFAVGDDEFTVEAEGDEEVLEASTRVVNKRKVAAAATRRTSTPVRRVPTRRK